MIAAADVTIIAAMSSTQLSPSLTATLQFNQLVEVVTGFEKVGHSVLFLPAGDILHNVSFEVIQAVRSDEIPRLNLFVLIMTATNLGGVSGFSGHG